MFWLSTAEHHVLFLEDALVEKSPSILPFPVQMAESADSRYEVSCAEMFIFEALKELIGARSECVGGWVVGRLLC